ncbi:Gti1/Pac2 family-domain-containing protein [Phellopilus nigrolimitatus]|nr:Gti1/Pac2 family-domain-containing protein [Phellopilus nigrolimitatus]
MNMQVLNVAHSSAGPSALVPAFALPATQRQAQAQVQPPTTATLFHDGSAPVFRACASAMQCPTLMNVRIRSTRDANQIFYAVARNVLPMTVRRLDAEERRAITSGNVYVWEERGANSEATGLGIERWTDGMRWSPSRVRDEFLFYHQKELDPDEAADLPPTRWARIVRPRASGSDGSSSDASPDKIPHQQASNDPERLIKQTYSVIVALPEDRQRGIFRKWHLTAYFTQATVDDLSTVDEMLPSPHVAVPEGWFRSARAGKARRDTARQRQITFTQNYSPDASGPSGSSPLTFHPTQTPSVSVFSPQEGFPHLTPQAAYTGFAREVENRMQVDVPTLLPPPGGSYTIPPVPPPPQSVTSLVPGPVTSYDNRPLLNEKPDSSRERLVQDIVVSSLPNTFDPSVSRATPLHGHNTSHGHPYANAYPAHINRTGGNTRPSPYVYHSPAQSLSTPLDVSVPGPSGSDRNPPGPIRGSFSTSSLGRPSSGPANSPKPFNLRDLEWQERSRVSSSPSPRRQTLALAPVSVAIAPSYVPRPLSRSPRLEASPVISANQLSEEGERSLVPLDNLENAVHFPRRDPTDDALLRRFDALRTTPSASSIAEQ